MTVSMRRRLVAGNWKMHGSRDAIQSLVCGIKGGIGGINEVNVAVCPPFVYLNEVGAMLEGTSVALGAQDVCQVPTEGAYTGEVSAAMLKECGCKYVIVGHSERRHIYNESDTLVVEKYIAAQQQALTPILCVGETLEQRETGRTQAVIDHQLDALFVLDKGVDSLARAVIAYEPVWAIGTGKTATPAQAQEVHEFIRAKVARHNPGVAAGLVILYGGSVKGSNAAELLAMPDIDGGLIGGASLKAGEFLQICAAAGA
jgi:triosephosphate isomerase